MTPAPRTTNRTRRLAAWSRAALVAALASACSARPIVDDDTGGDHGGDPQCGDGVNQVGEFCDDSALGGCHVCVVDNTNPSNTYAFVGEAPYDNSGSYIARAGDVDGDGHDDLLIGAHFNDEGGAFAGKAYLMLSSTILARPPGTIFDLGAEASYHFVGELDNDAFGNVASAGDVDGDGNDDLVFGAHRNGAGGVRAGKAYLMLASKILAAPAGTTFEIGAEASYAFVGEAEEQCGTVVSSADIDGDGRSDLIIGAPESDAGGLDSGATYVMLAADIAAAPPESSFELSTQASYRFVGQASNRAGWSAAADVDSDGRDDLIIGRYPNAGTDNAGTAHLMLASAVMSQPRGHSFAVGSDYSYRFTGEPIVSTLGLQISAAGDVDGDGSEDLLFGAPSDQTNGWSAGKSYLMLASVITSHPSGTSFELGQDASYSFLGEQTYDGSGTSISKAGDVDGDGLDDILIGAHGYDRWGPDEDTGTPMDHGKVYLMLSRDITSKTEGHLFQLGEDASAAFVGEAGGDALGRNRYSLASGGDVDGDGKADLLLSASNNDSAAGKTYLLLSPF